MNYAPHHYIKKTSITEHDMSKQKEKKKERKKLKRVKPFLCACVVITLLDMC